MVLDEASVCARCVGGERGLGRQKEGEGPPQGRTPSGQAGETSRRGNAIPMSMLYSYVVPSLWVKTYVGRSRIGRLGGQAHLMGLPSVGTMNCWSAWTML